MLHGYMDGWGSGLLSTSPLSNKTISVRALWCCGTSYLYSLWLFVRYPVFVHRLRLVKMVNKLGLIVRFWLGCGVEAIRGHLRSERAVSQNSKMNNETRWAMGMWHLLGEGGAILTVTTHGRTNHLSGSKICSGHGLDAALKCALRFPWYWVSAFQFGGKVAAAIQPGGREAAFSKMAVVKMVAVPAARNLTTFSCINIHNKSKVWCCP